MNPLGVGGEEIGEMNFSGSIPVLQYFRLSRQFEVFLRIHPLSIKYSKVDILHLECKMYAQLCIKYKMMLNGEE